MNLVENKKTNKFNFSLQVFIIFISIFLLDACSLSQSHKLHPISNRHSYQQRHYSSDSFKKGNFKLPIAIPEGEFFKVAGWISNNQIIYITNHEQSSNLYSYNFALGRSELIYKSNYPIVTAVVSPTKKYILIQSSPSTYEGNITVINTNGTIKWQKTIASFELEYEWNPYNESEILVSKFNEDWTFKVFKLNLKEKSLTDLSLSQPFVGWVDNQHIAFINWDQNNPALSASLIIKNLSNLKERTAFQKVYQFSTFKELLMTIAVNDREKTKATYTFFKEPKSQPIFSFSIPQLSEFSDWLVPFYDFNENKQEFLTFRPLRSTEADSYTEGFQLVSYDLKNGKSRVLFNGMENEPLSFSPSGEACLYGGNFEKLININTRKIFNLVKE